MRSTITLNGINSNTIEGLLIQNLPPISKPLMRTQIEEIDGRDGDVITKLGFSAYNKEITIGLYGDFDINQIIQYFTSQGTVVFSNEPDKYYYYQIIDQIDFERLIRYRTATVTMHCQPFKYSTTEGTQVFDNSSNLLTIPNSTTTTNGVTVTANNNILTISGTASAATEFYIPIDTLSLSVGKYGMYALGSGTNPEACSLRVIYNSPSNANSFGGNYVTLKNNQTVSLIANLSNAKTYNYVYLYIAANKAMDFTLNLSIEDAAQSVVTGEGNLITLEGTAFAPFDKFDLKGDTTQQTYSGKNLFNINDNSKSQRSSKSIDGNKLTVTCTTAGTAYTVIELPNSDALLGKTCRLKVGNISVTSGSGTTQGMIRVLASLKTNLTSLAGDEYGQVRGLGDNLEGAVAFPNSYPDSKDCFVLVVYVGNRGGSTVVGEHGDYEEVQLELGSTATSFEPYVGGIPAPNPDYPQEVQVVTGEQTVTITDGAEESQEYEVNLGKNLFNYDNASQGYLGGSGQVVSNSTAMTSEYIEVDSNTAYTASANTTYRYIGIGEYAANKDYIQKTQENTNSFTITTSATTKYIRVFYNQSTNVDKQTLIDTQAQIELGSTATTYAPYISHFGKNMLNPTTFVKGRVDNGNIGYADNVTSLTSTATSVTFTTNANYRGIASALIPVQPSTSYIDSWGASGTVGKYIDFYDSSKNWISRATATPYSTPSNCYYIRVSYQLSNAGTATVSQPQLEAGSTATAFEPFIGGQLDLCKIGTYQDYIYKDGGDWYLHKATGKAVLDGSGTWYRQATSGGVNYRFSVIVSDIKQAVTGVVGYSDKLIPVTTDTYSQDGISGTSSAQRISIRYDSIFGQMTIAELQAWLADNPITAYYVLATPTDIQITNSSLIAQLEALVTDAHAYKNTTTLVSTSENMPHIMSVEVAKNNDATITNSGNTTAKPVMTVYGSGTVGIYLNGNQIFNVNIGNNQYITIDTANMEAYKDTTDNLMNRLVDGDYSNFVLQTGENQISFSGSVSKLEISNYSRWI